MQALRLGGINLAITALQQAQIITTSALPPARLLNLNNWAHEHPMTADSS